MYLGVTIYLRTHSRPRGTPTAHTIRQLLQRTMPLSFAGRHENVKNRYFKKITFRILRPLKYLIK